MKLPFAPAFLGLSIAMCGARVQAQHAPAKPTPAPTPSPAATADLRAHFGIEAATRLMRSADADERLRGVERAAAMHTPEALSLLVRAASAGVPGGYDPRAPIEGVARNDPRALLAAVRGLAEWIDREPARNALASVISAPAQSFATRTSFEASDDAAADDMEGAARVALARREAAVALATGGGQLAVEALIALARSGGPAQDAALDALAIQPPTWPLLGGVALTTPSTIALAASVGDLRSVGAIEAALRASDPSLRAAALSALGSLGDVRALEPARTSERDGDPRVRLAAASVLVRLGAKDAEQAVANLIADDKTTLAGLRLAEQMQGERVTKAAAARAIVSADPDVRGAAVTVLGRQTDSSAVAALAQLVLDPLLAGDVAFALGRSPSHAAMAALVSLAAADSPLMRRLAARAYFVRRWVRGERESRLDALLWQWAASADPADRAIARQALIAFDEMTFASGVADKDPKVRRGAAMGAVAAVHRGRQDATRWLQWLAVESDSATRQVLVAGLLDPDASARVPSSMLVDRAESGEADAPLAALALARRSDGEHKTKIDGFLSSHDPILRAHCAMGLADSAAEDATGRLARAYAWEGTAEVRRALVAALVKRQGKHQNGAPLPLSQALAWAARLDPDRVVRATSLSGEPQGAREIVPEVAWIRLAPAQGASMPAHPTAILLGGDGIGRPVAFDDDGYALVAGVSAGEAVLRLAPRVPPYEAALP